SNMQLRSVKVQTFTLILLTSAGILSTASAQVKDIAPGSERPMFRRYPGKLHAARTPIEAASIPLKTWNGSFTYSGTKYSYNMVGTAPSSGTSTTVAVEIIPVEVVITNRQ